MPAVSNAFTARMPSSTACPACGPARNTDLGPSKSGTATAQLAARSWAPSAASCTSLPVAIWYEGAQLVPTLSSGVWSETTGRGPDPVQAALGTTRVVTASSACPCESLVR